MASEPKRRLTVFLVTMIAILIMAWLPSLADPVLVIPETKFDFGQMPQGAQTSHVFWLKSVGDEPVHITQISAGCSCTKTPLESDTIAPGDSTRLEITFSSRRYRNSLTKSIRLSSNADSAQRKIQIQATVVPEPDSMSPLRFEPFSLDFAALSNKPITELPLIITNTSDELLKLTLLDIASDLMTVKLPDTLAPGEVGGCLVKLTEAGQKGSRAKSITLGVNDYAQSRFSIPILLPKPPEPSPQ
jgi:hypothetical protein